MFNIVTDIAMITLNTGENQQFFLAAFSTMYIYLQVRLFFLGMLYFLRA